MTLAVLALGLLMAGQALCMTGGSTFGIHDDKLVLDGRTFQVISGSIHYFRIHPAYWRDRLERAVAMGINTVEVYTPWNLHEPNPGQYSWSGFSDIDRWMALIQEMGLKVLLRPGPYICAEWDNGGFPHWFASSKVVGGRTMRTRTNDPVYLEHVGRWWATLFARMRRYLIENGGPILMVQVENEYGFCGEDKDYMRHLASLVRTHLSSNVLLFTTDPPGVAPRGTLPGEEVYTVVDFGPGYDPSYAFNMQKSLNAPGKSPPFCSEFYTGWLSHWGEQMANTSTGVLLNSTQVLLEYANSTASLSFYMAHGGTNFGFWAGANVDGSRYMPHITSYDYDAPISEAGDYCQPGIGGECKYYALRDLIARHTGRSLPPVPKPPAIQAYGRVDLRESLPLLQAVEQMYGPYGGVRVELPDNMEEFGQRWGLILYRTYVPTSALDQPATLDLGAPVHDFASVFVDGQLAGRLDRSRPGDTTLSIQAPMGRASGDNVQLDVVVEAMGRQNFGCDTGNWDMKGLTSQNVTLNGKTLRKWQVFPLQLDDPSGLAYASGTAGAAMLSAVRRRMLTTTVLPAAADASAGSTFFRGNFSISGTKVLRGTEGHLADTYLALHGWGKGIAWINGFNLGWYWASLGPQMTLYVPGPILREGTNEVVLLEVEQAAKEAAVMLVKEPDFHGPGSTL